MKKIVLALTLFSSFIFGCAHATLPQQQTLAPMLKKVMPTVVNISVMGQISIKLPFLNPNQPLPPAIRKKLNPKFAGLGSGIIVDANHGYILTNAHLVTHAKIITVNLYDGRRVRARVLGADTKSDIALLKINAKHLKAITLGDSSRLQVGDYVAAIGNPFGLNQTVTSGVISGLGRAHLGIEGFENFIQIDAPINPGNSGGALVNLNGELIGMNTAIITPFRKGGNVGIGLAIPVDMCKNVINQIVKYGKVEHSLIGVLVQNITPALADALDLANTKGALISDVSGGSPAQAAGLKPQDVIIRINDKPVRDAFQVSTDIGLTRPNSVISITVLRHKKPQLLHVTTIGVEQAKKAAERAPTFLLSGLALRNFDQLVNNRPIKGVQIIDVGNFSVAYSCGLRKGDVIVAAANSPISNIEQLQEAASSHPDSLLLTIRHGSQGIVYIVLEK